MVKARLHLICGNCGNSDEFELRIDTIKELNERTVDLVCKDCGTIHQLDDYADFDREIKDVEKD